YPNLEYVIQDGGSRDNTPAILDRYRARLTHCESTPDRGQAQAINRGFRRTSGDVLAYLNSDDLLLPGAVAYVAAYLEQHPDIDVVYGHRIVIDENDADVGRWVLPPHDAGALLWFDYVPQETLFWRRRIWDKIGGLDESFQYALDWDLLLRFLAAGARFARLPRFLGAFRVHPAQKTTALWHSVGVPETNRLLQRCHGRTISTKERFLRILPYLCRHALWHKFYRFGVFSY
ncbi:MAG: glycosyltransferase, partial [Planctomycetes bacterium]|nr:glycosyltransferase [Planctomycetota bacterium]